MLQILFTFFVLITTGSIAKDIETLDELQGAIETGPNKKVGFLSETNYQSVRRVLPSTVEPVICDSGEQQSGIQCSSKDDILALVQQGVFIAGLISGRPEDKDIDHVHVFSSTLISPKAMFMAPDRSLSYPHGTPAGSTSSRDLSLALNAAIVRVQTKGLDQNARLNNMPFEFVSVHTCKSDDYAAFQVPNKNEATGLLKKILDEQKFKLGAFGPFDWGDNDGNYLVNPPKGFYPDLMTAIFDEFQSLAGPDNVTYGPLNLERIYSKTQTFRDLFDGRTYATEPYFIIDASYTGTDEPCFNHTDCRPASLPMGHEMCTNFTLSNGSFAVDPTTGEPLKMCQHPERPRIDFFRMSCTTIGSDSTFLTLKTSTSSSSRSIGTEAIVGITIAVVLLELLS